ncbi:hypothetical protein ACQQ2N_04225 [Dokdonella sp. MW10]|uniref:hypothetical protein n=1 Tax=Dokdonella sp. MW10 TaxID=2992926 RepID=UPI003F7EACB5
MDHDEAADLLARYPRLPGSDVLRARGIQCGPGWRSVVHMLCELLEHDIDNGGARLQVHVIKEKLGSLRVQATDASDYQRGLIAFASRLSETICEICGDPVAEHRAPALPALAARCAKHVGDEVPR